MSPDVKKAIIEKNGKYLLLLRSRKDKYWPLTWDFPGGRREEGETPEEALVREVSEETSLKVKPVTIVGCFYYKEKDFKFTIYNVKLLSRKDEVRLSEDHEDFKWLTKDEIRQMKTMPFFDKLWS